VDGGCHEPKTRLSHQKALRDPQLEDVVQISPTYLPIHINDIKIVFALENYTKSKKIRLQKVNKIELSYLGLRIIDLNLYYLWEADDCFLPTFFFVRGLLESIGNLIIQI